jgi:hypothetical protein
MTVGTAQLSEGLQTLIDSRLDTIDRMLLGRISRQERLDIVREVESQIHELLYERHGDELTRDDVLAVLARLDPPEAYIPEDTTDLPGSARPSSHPGQARSALKPDSRAGRVGGVMGIVALALMLFLPLGWLIGESLGSEAVLFVLCGGDLLLIIVSSILAIVLGIYSRRTGPWALVGIVTGILALLLSLASSLVVLLLLL